MKRTVLLGLTFAGVAACGDNKGVDIDAAPIDAAIDAAIDAPIDAPPPVFSGSFSAIEAAVLTPGTSTVFGQGLQLGLSFTDSSMIPAPLMEETPGAPIGCKVWEYTPAQVAASSVGVDEGPATFTFTAGTGMPTTPPAVPACIFSPNVGYTCPDTGTASGGGVIAAGPAMGTATLTDTDITYNAGNSTGRYVRIAGAAMAANNGVFPIVAIAGANTIVYANPARVVETLPAAAQHVNLAGVGPIPSAPDPGFLADDYKIAVAHTMGGGGHVANFSLDTGAGTIGDDFTLDNASTGQLVALPRNGAPITFTCMTNCGAANAAGSLVNIITTDAPVAGLSPFAMPPPVTKRVQIRCAQLGTGNITIPAAYSAKIMSSGATRIQTTYIRGALLSSTSPPVTGVAGHALVGFTTVAAAKPQN